ncbi:MAG: hypothetical protein JWO99_73 [Candidatus Saccharibacteria bacterium]|nr:hypothetical protein [Candidatus Saccharibacteria bacterium]
MSQHSESPSLNKASLEHMPPPKPTISARERVLGYGAVQAADTHAQMVTEMSAYSAESREYATLENIERSQFDKADDGVEMIRSIYDTLDEKGEGIVDRYFSSIVPLFLMKHISSLTPKGEPEISWKTWLKQEATTPQLLNIAQKHNYIIDRQAGSKVVAEHYATHLQKFLEAVDELAEEGKIAILPKDSTNMKLVISDIFDTALKDIAAYFDPSNTQEVVLAQSTHPANYSNRIIEVVSHFSRNLTHEFVHALLCRSYEVIDTPIAARWINEALTEEFAREIREKNGKPLPENEDIVYLPERQLLDVLLGQSLDPAGSLVRAQIAYTGEAWDRDLFVAHVDALWHGKGVLRKINEAIAQEEKRLKASPEYADTIVTTIQTRAVLTIKEQLVSNPNGLLRIGVDKVMSEMGLAAQET